MAIIPKLNLFQRALNRLGRPLGIAPFPIARERSEGPPSDRRRVFDGICNENYWGSEESLSGPGSELRGTEKYRKALTDFLRQRQIRSMFDAPCGDLNWMGEVISALPIHYIGGDISDAVLEVARKRHPDLDLRHFDICCDEFPDVEVWHCRDALFHLSFDDVWLALANAAQSNIELALLTSHRAVWLKNIDINTGGWRLMDLERPPFSLPRPQEYIPESLPPAFPRAVGVWPIEVIREAVARYQRT
jgi:SAM-dependent methyltransferase